MVISQVCDKCEVKRIGESLPPSVKLKKLLSSLLRGFLLFAIKELIGEVLRY
ncbi:hypothetical protein [Arsenophonus endosymbiont of Aphis craccivora]|uniref:hypothetical protein n=1 Tax=Arsenophonus endosymbiont of Aphis craccivora TaxID=1231049 RepID=UPI001EE29936|nr:hypothetical protein [Arsenophonus endosymbiont of Aphis craccivora]